MNAEDMYDADAITRAPPCSTQESQTDGFEALRTDTLPEGTTDDMYLHQMLGTEATDGLPPSCGFVRRTQSCGGHGLSTNARRVRITYHDEKLRERYERNAHGLLQAAFNDATADSTNAILARKAPRYRRILEKRRSTCTTPRSMRRRALGSSGTTPRATEDEHT